MEYPQRTLEHIRETESWKIFENKVPPEWIVRNVSERDYGIDAYIEIVGKNKLVTGELCSIQLKGSGDVKWRNEVDGKVKVAKLSGIKKATINYWMGLPVPVFLILCDCGEQKALFAPVKSQVRQNFAQYINNNQQTMSFEFNSYFELGSDLGNEVFTRFYYKEKQHYQFSTYLRELLIHWQEYSDFIIENQHRDCFMEVDYDVQCIMIHIYQTCQFLSHYFNIKWTVDDLSDVYGKDKDTWKDNCLLHEQSLDYVLKQLQPIYMEILRKAKNYVVEKQKFYWLEKDPILYHLCLNSHF
ncbi:MAG: DUF4365 domain-containing protein [Candidatus Omnitrophica bacterium]|nr:DUF4365 domain-containing protein [Candidatus Omnitrophota bacterium]